MSENKQLQFEMTEERYRQLTAIAHVCGLTRPDEVINYALTLFVWQVQHVMRGLAVGAIDKEKEQMIELRADVLDHARKFAETSDMSGVFGG